MAYALKQQGVYVHANDLASYSHVIGKALIETDRDNVDLDQVRKKLDHLNNLEGVDGFITEHYSRQAWFFQEHNAKRIDAIRPEIDKIADNENEHAILLTSLLLAADKVDSTVATHLAYLKTWAKRSYNDMELKMPRMLRGDGLSTNIEAEQFVESTDLSEFDVTYIDPPYKTPAYFRTYHIWETFVRWDDPETTGVPRRRADEKEFRTGFNSKKTVVATMDNIIKNTNSRHLLMSYSDEGDVPLETLLTLFDNAGRTATVFPIAHKRYVGSKLGQNDKTGKKTGRVGGRTEGKVKKTNTEYLIWAS